MAVSEGPARHLPDIESSVEADRPVRSCPRPPRLTYPPLGAPQASAGWARLGGELGMAGGSLLLRPARRVDREDA
jgi:hypothetical protein